MVFTQGLLRKPFSTAFLAKRAAPIMTEGLEVLVHEVMEAMTTAPFEIEVAWPFTEIGRSSRELSEERYEGIILLKASFE